MKSTKLKRNAHVVNININTNTINNYFASPLPPVKPEEKVLTPTVVVPQEQQESKTDPIAESCLLCGIATSFDCRNGMKEFKYEISNPEKFIRGNQLKNHQIRRHPRTLKFFTSVANIPNKTVPETQLPTIFDFNGFICGTKECSDSGLATSLNNTGRTIITRKEIRLYNQNDIMQARIRLRVFAPTGHVFSPIPASSNASETVQLVHYLQNQSDFGLVIVPGSATFDAVVFSKRTGDRTPVGFKNCSNAKFPSATSIDYTFHRLKDHKFPEVLRCSEFGSIIIHSQQKKTESRHVYMNRETLKITNLKEPHTFLAQENAVLQHLIENHSFAGDFDVVNYMESKDCRLGALGEVIAQLFFGGQVSTTETAGTADIFVNKKTLQLKVRTGGGKRVQFHLESTQGISYEGIDAFVYMVKVASTLRVYVPMTNADFTSILKNGNKSFATKKINASGFPSTSVKHFEHFVDVDLAVAPSGRESGFRFGARLSYDLTSSRKPGLRTHLRRPVQSLWRRARRRKTHHAQVPGRPVALGYKS